MELTRREKRLISAMNAGFQIHHEDGHRWITQEGNSEFGLQVEDQLYNNGLGVVSKVYGNYDEALNRIDSILKLLGHKNLEDMYIDFGVGING